MRARGYIILTIISLFFLVLNSVIPDWIEVIFHIDPDQYRGYTETTITLLLCIVTIAFLSLSIYELRHMKNTR